MHEKLPPPTLVQASELTGQMLSMILEAHEQRRIDEVLARIADISIVTAASAESTGSLHRRWQKLSADLAQVIQTDGVVVLRGRPGDRHRHRAWRVRARRIQAELEESPDGILCSSCLREDYGIEGELAAGAMGPRVP